MKNISYFLIKILLTSIILFLISCTGETVINTDLGDAKSSSSMDDESSAVEESSSIDGEDSADTQSSATGKSESSSQSLPSSSESVSVSSEESSSAVVDAGSSENSSSSAIIEAGVTVLELYNADTDEKIATLTDSYTIDYDKIGTTKIAIVAQVEGTVEYVQFSLDDVDDFQTEANAPYAIKGDTDGDYSPWSPKDGNYALTVQAYDSDGALGDMITVSLTVTGTPAVSKAPFSIIAIPDTQTFGISYRGASPEMWGSQFQWIKDNVTPLNIKFVTHLGDIVDQWPDGYKGGVQENEWNPAVAAFDLIHDLVPYGISPGNHDANNWDGGGGDDWTNYDRNFPVSRFDGKDWYAGNKNNNLNSYQFFEAAGMEFMVLHIRYWPSADELAWGTSILDQYPEKRAIVVSHEIDQRGDNGEGFFTGPGESIWNAVKNNDNVFMMLSGHHCGRESKRVKPGSSGNDVHIIMSDYQCDEPNQAFLRIYEFVPQENKINAKTYSPWIQQYESDGDSEFTVDYQMD